MLKLLRRLAALSVLTCGLVGAYIAAPFYTAWTIREAVEANDSAYLERKIDWVPVRASLKESLLTYAITSDAQLTAPSEKPTWVQRWKSYLGKGAIDRMVETTVTPTGLHGALMVRKQVQERVLGTDPNARPPALERARELWSRTTRAVFTSYNRLELELIDQQYPERTIATVLELRGYEWILTGLKIKPTDKAQAAKFQTALR